MQLIKVFLSFISVSLNVSYASISDNWLVYSRFNVNELYVKKGMLTTLHFDSDIDYFLIGNLDVADVIKVNENTIAISTVLANKTTNLNVETKDSNYVFLLRTLLYEDRKEPNLHMNIINTEKQRNIKKKTNSKNNPAFDYNFTMRAQKEYRKIAPNKVWTDGKYTYLDYNGSRYLDRNLPIVSEVVDNIDTKVNMEVKNNVIIVDALAKKLTVSSNGAYVCIEYTGKKYEVY